MEDFVPFNIAKKLEEKGFKEECLFHYEKTGGFFQADSAYMTYEEAVFAGIEYCLNNLI